MSFKNYINNKSNVNHKKNYNETSDLYSIPFDKLSKFLNEANDSQLEIYRKALKEENVTDLIDILEEISYD